MQVPPSAGLAGPPPAWSTLLATSVLHRPWSLCRVLPAQSATDQVRHSANGSGGDPIRSIAQQRFEELDLNGSGRVSFLEVSWLEQAGGLGHMNECGAAGKAAGHRANAPAEAWP